MRPIPLALALLALAIPAWAADPPSTLGPSAFGSGSSSRRTIEGPTGRTLGTIRTRPDGSGTIESPTGRTEQRFRRQGNCTIYSTPNGNTTGKVCD